MSDGNKNAAYCCKQILEAAPYKIAAVEQLTSHPNKTNKTWKDIFEESKDDLITNVL